MLIYFLSTKKAKSDEVLEQKYMILTIMANRLGYENAIKEARNEWLENLLGYVGIEVHLIAEMDDPQFVHHLIQNKIQITEYLDLGALRVEMEDDIIGEWGVPEMKLKQDSGGMYYHIEVECWSIMEEDITT